MTASLDYLNEAQGILERIRATQMDAVARAAEICTAPFPLRFSSSNASALNSRVYSRYFLSFMPDLLVFLVSPIRSFFCVHFFAHFHHAPTRGATRGAPHFHCLV